MSNDTGQFNLEAFFIALDHMVSHAESHMDILKFIRAQYADAKERGAI